MSEASLLYLPVSLGEAIDKITILDIKLERINDHRKKDILNEYTLLYDKLREPISKYSQLYNSMKKINIDIWNMMDILRDENISEEKYLKVCKECIEYNDIRFRIKNKINYISNSHLKEQKGYRINRLELNINIDVISSIVLLDIVKYLSFIYDEIHIISKFNIDFLKSNLDYDLTILFISYIEDNIDYSSRIIIDTIEDTDLYRLFNIDKDVIERLL